MKKQYHFTVQPEKDSGAMKNQESEVQLCTLMFLL
jgi:hypothetical protein